MCDKKEIVKRMWREPDFRVQMQKCLRELSPEKYQAVLDDPDYDELPFARSAFHIHTDLGSPMDSVLKASEYQKWAAFNGVTTLTLTDHGTMYGIVPLDDLVNQFNKGSDVKETLGIGCELYVCDDITETGRKKPLRRHLCAYALDDVGYKALCHLVTGSQYRLVIVGGMQFPCVSFAMLNQYIGPSAAAHGHVILTSACIGGVISAVATENMRHTEELADKTDLHEQHLDLQKRAAYRMQLDGKLKPDIQKELDNASGIKYIDLQGFDAFLADEEHNLQELKNSVFDESDLESHFRDEILKYDKLAGHGNWFIELQNHGIRAEVRLMPVLAKLALELDIPLVAANDAHMLSKEDCELRKYVNALRFGSNWENPNEGDDELYLKTDKELYRALCAIVSRDTAFKAMMGRDEIASRFTFHLQKAEHYPKYYC